MGEIRKVLLVVDSWMLQHDANRLLDGLGLEGVEVIFYHVADYSGALTSSGGQYTENVLPGVGIMPVERFAAERKREVAAFLGGFRQSPACMNIQVDVDPQPAAKISQKAEKENVDLAVIGVPNESRDRTYKRAIAERVLRQSSCAVLTIPPKNS